MSKRFGRQQKRKLNATITELETRLADVKKQYRGLVELAARNKQIVDDTARVLGEHFITLDPTVIDLQYLRELGNEYRHTDRSYVRGGTLNDSLTSEYVERALCAIQHLPVLKCEAYLSEVRSAVHYMFTFNGKTAGYAIAQSVIAQQPGFKEQIRKNLSEAVTRMFMETEVPR